MRDTEETRAAHRYDSDVTDTEWDILGPVIESCQSQRRGRPLATDLRAVLNAIFYLNQTGCPWRYLPKDVPPSAPSIITTAKGIKTGRLPQSTTHDANWHEKRTLITQRQRLPSAIVRAARERQHPCSARAALGANASPGESGISSSLPWVT
ncbi:MAG: transposase [Chromatiaceae bacterium]|nr:MAG: transposase [Chromatiaceae bacterium]